MQVWSYLLSCHMREFTFVTLLLFARYSSRIRLNSGTLSCKKNREKIIDKVKTQLKGNPALLLGNQEDTVKPRNKIDAGSKVFLSGLCTPWPKKLGL